jgi:phospholipid/cholesterol/gamma-HCH transport system permease protein
VIARIGRGVLGELIQVVSYATLAVVTALALARRPLEGAAVVSKQTARQVVFTGADAILLVVFIASMLAITVVAVGASTLGGINQPGLFGELLARMLVREIAPVATAVLVTLRSCAAITVELGYMSARKEVEGIETMGIDPVKLLLLPRFVGMTTATIGLTFVFATAAFLAGFATAAALGIIPFDLQVLAHHAQHVGPLDVAIAGIKAAVFGVMIASIACYHGLAVRDDLTRIPRGTSRALVESLSYCSAVSVAITLITS